MNLHFAVVAREKMVMSLCRWSEDALNVCRGSDLTSGPRGWWSPGAVPRSDGSGGTLWFMEKPEPWKVVLLPGGKERRRCDEPSHFLFGEAKTVVMSHTSSGDRRRRKTTRRCVGDPGSNRARIPCWDTHLPDTKLNLDIREEGGANNLERTPGELERECHHLFRDENRKGQRSAELKILQIRVPPPSSQNLHTGGTGEGERERGGS